MSAGYAVDLGNTLYTNQVANLAVTDARLSGADFGYIADMIQANSFTSLVAMGQSLNLSGQLRIQVQTSDTTNSGDFTDPTSGLAAFPTVFASGGYVWINSGGLGGGIFTSFTSGQCIHAASGNGFLAFAGFQRPGRYARCRLVSGQDTFVGELNLGFVGQLKTTGSGGGFTLAPSSGSVNV